MIKILARVLRKNGHEVVLRDYTRKNGYGTTYILKLDKQSFTTNYQDQIEAKRQFTALLEVEFPDEH